MEGMGIMARAKEKREVPSVRITDQFRRGNSMVYDLSCEDTRLTVEIALSRDETGAFTVTAHARQSPEQPVIAGTRAQPPTGPASCRASLGREERSFRLSRGQLGVGRAGAPRGARDRGFVEHRSPRPLGARSTGSSLVLPSALAPVASTVGAPLSLYPHSGPPSSAAPAFAFRTGASARAACGFQRSWALATQASKSSTPPKMGMIVSMTLPWP